MENTSLGRVVLFLPEGDAPKSPVPGTALGYFAPAPLAEKEKALGEYLGKGEAAPTVLERLRPDAALFFMGRPDAAARRCLGACLCRGVRPFRVGAKGEPAPLTVQTTQDILGVKIAVTDMESTVAAIRQNLDWWRGQYICVSNVHTTVTAHDDAAYRAVQNGGVLALPDGGPLSAYSRAHGWPDARRVTGPDLMKTLLADTAAPPLRHYFYGSTPETLALLKDALARRYPGAVVAGMVSPPFRPLTPQEDDETVAAINAAKPDIVWVGLGAPKQEQWMAAHRGRVDALMVGVGAAFDYEAGNIRRAPAWMQRLSLEWLYRLMQDPARLFKRYFVTNLRYLWLTRK